MHVIVFPWLAFGHMIPFLDLAKCIAKQGHQVSFISTPRNIDRLPKPPSTIAPFVKFIPLTLPHVQNLPENVEATMDVPPSNGYLLMGAFDGLESQLTNILESSPVDWIIYDYAPYWLPPIARKLNIKCVYFCVMSAWFLCFLGTADSMVEGIDSNQFIVQPKWIPFQSNFAFKKYQVNRVASAKSSRIKNTRRLGMVIKGCDVLIVRYWPEFDPVWLESLKKLHHTKKVIPLGFMPPPLVEQNDGNWLYIKEFLDKQNKGSVVYVAFGSEAALSQQELSELALGLKQSGLPFCWILRKPPGSGESASVELPDGFEESTKDQGIVWKSWAPQVNILSHDSIGGFLTHCGYSSVIEGLSFGKPLIMLTMVMELISIVLASKKVGVEVARNEDDGTFTRDSIAESVKIVMVAEDGQVYRDNAMKMRSMLRDQDMQNGYIDNFIEHLEIHRPTLDAVKTIINL